jgi:Kef-type K+ transport system membrane component KefB
MAGGDGRGEPPRKIMTRAAALLLSIGGAWLVGRIGSDPTPRSMALALGLALIAATLTGSQFERARLPRVSGYLLFGLVCGPYLGNVITRPMARELQILNGVAIALIALIAGLELNYAHLKAKLPTMAALGGLTLLFMYVVLLPIIWAAWRWLPIAPELHGLARLALACVVTTLVVSFSPTVTIAVIADTRSRGPLCEMVLAVVVIADLALIVFFTLAMQFVRWTAGVGAANDVGLLVRLTWEIFGSFAFGGLLGAVFALYIRYVGRELTVALLVLCVVFAQLGPRLEFEPLLAALAAGLVIENIGGRDADRLRTAVERGSLPVLVVFFAAAGASLSLDALARVGLAAASISILRLGLVRGSTLLAARVAGVDRAIANGAWMGLISQAGVTLGLTILVAQEFPDWGRPIESLLVALIAMHELIGPVLFRAALARAGEVGRSEALA